MRILYFAWVRQRIGIDEEEVAVPESVRDVAGLLDWLKTRGPGFEEALRDPSAVRIAVNREFAQSDAALSPDDEVALFPPVTGG